MLCNSLHCLAHPIGIVATLVAVNSTYLAHARMQMTLQRLQQLLPLTVTTAAAPLRVSVPGGPTAVPTASAPTPSPTTPRVAEEALMSQMLNRPMATRARVAASARLATMAMT